MSSGRMSPTKPPPPKPLINSFATPLPLGNEPNFVLFNQANPAIQKSEYKTLKTPQCVLSYVSKIESICTALGTSINNFSERHFEVKEIGDGNLNLVYIVTNTQSKKSVVVKQALPYLRCIGERFPLAKERMHYEILGLREFAKLVPEHVPKIYFADAEMCLMAMEYLDKHVVMRKEMIEGISHPLFADHISTILSKTLFYTSPLFLSSEKRNNLILKFNSNPLRKLTEDFVFTFPYMQHETNNIKPLLKEDAVKIWRDTEFKLAVLNLKELFITDTSTLVHADLHSGSIMLNQDETYVIDFEFAYMGPYGADTGFLLANLLMSWIASLFRGQSNEYSQDLFKMIKTFYRQFEEKFLVLWDTHVASKQSSSLLHSGFLSPEALIVKQKQFMQKIWMQTLGFAGCEMFRRQLGFAGVEDLRGIEDSQSAANAARMALGVGTHLIKNYEKIKTLDEIFALVKEKLL